jgi:L-fuculose-phosphate aldolase
MDSAVARALAMAHRILFVAGHSHLVYGHASARGTEGRILVKPRGLGLQEVTPGHIAEMDADGKQLSGPLRLHNEMPLHTEIYRVRSDVGAIVHTHPPASVGLTLLGRSAITGGTFTQDDLPFTRDGIGWYPAAELVQEATQGRALARALGARRAVVLANHGVVTVGATIVEATMRAVLLEAGLRSRAQALTMSGGRIGRLHAIAPAAARRMADQFDVQPNRDDAVWAFLERECVRVLGPVDW